jgi:integrase
VFYSLRHSYATFQLLIENINIEVLAKQMGTSMAMISKFYSDVTAKKATEQLRGNKIHELLNRN